MGVRLYCATKKCYLSRDPRLVLRSAVFSGIPISLNKLNINLRKYCEFFGFTENHENESIIIFHSCSTNLNVDEFQMETFHLLGSCKELHIGNTPRSIMTKGNSVTIGTPYGNFIRGNKDKLMITYRRESSHDYSMKAACSVLFEGDMHFFGGTSENYFDPSTGEKTEYDFSRQHFVIETKRSGQLVKMTKQVDLEVRFLNPSCITFEITNVVLLCFDRDNYGGCYSFDEKLKYIGGSYYPHAGATLAKYESSVLTRARGMDLVRLHPPSVFVCFGIFSHQRTDPLRTMSTPSAF